MSAPADQSVDPISAADLARGWLDLARGTAYLPLPAAETAQRLAELVDELVAALRDADLDDAATVRVGSQVGETMVELDLIGMRSLTRTVELLGDGLPRLVELRGVGGLRHGVLRLLGALAGGYAHGLRRRTFEEQEEIKKALLRAKHDAERGLRVSEAWFREIFSVSAVGIAISDRDGVLVDGNAAFAEIVGHPRDELAGLALKRVLQAETDEELADAYRSLTEQGLPRFRRQRSLVGADGGTVWAHIGASLLHDADGVPTHHITVVEDITELQMLRQELSDQTLHDKLTGLPNEQYFMSHLQEVLERASPSAQVTLCRVNLDNFAVINDGIGRDTAEKLLCSIAGRLRALVAGERAMVARMGGDDFAILVEDGPDPPAVGILGASINGELAEPFYVGERGLAVSACVGVVRRPAAGISPAELVRAADSTLHRTKRGGRGQWGAYDAHADAEERERYLLAAQLPGAWENGEISLEYQPLQGLDSGGVVALQALLRWDRADGTVLAHEQCLALAEQTGLVNALGPWMLRTACAELAQWGSGDPALLLRVDLTPRLSQDPDLVGVLNTALADTGMQATRMRVGVPMVTLSQGRGDVTDNVQVLADLGAGVVLLGAAAGPGYMAFVEDLPVTAVEVAPQVVRRIAASPGDESLVSRAIRQTIPLMHSVGTKVITSGVDTAEQAGWWRQAGADAARGAHFGPAMPPDELPALLG